MLKIAILIILISPMRCFADKITTIGWIENVKILPEGFYLDAKIDTGADHSSIGAYDIQQYNRGKAIWVRFKVKSNRGKVLEFDRPLYRLTRIKLKQGGFAERPVVNLDLCIGQQQYSAYVNLAARKNFKYRMIVGRSFLSNRFLVDPGQKRLSKPICK